jgi:gamma-glutamylcyclotransferase (GGCT)/AIG2-like uncharacterized protein YtfP
MRLFLYGTLLDPELMTRLAGRPIPVISATLDGWRRVALPGSRYPTLRRARGTVFGAVVTVNGRTLARLTAYEGPAYSLKQLTVSVARGKTVAQAWIAPGGTCRGWTCRGWP